MSFAVTLAPAKITSCEIHEKHTRKGSWLEASREKKITIEINLSDPSFLPAIDERFPGAELMIKCLAGAASSPKNVIDSSPLGPVFANVYASDKKTKVFGFDLATSKGKPTLRISDNGASVLMTVVIVGGLPRDKLSTIDDFIGADVFLTMGVAQTDLFDTPGSSAVKTASVKINVASDKQARLV